MCREIIKAKCEAGALLSLDEAFYGKEIPLGVRESQVLLDLEYWGFDAAWHTGQIMVHRDLSEEVREIFAEIVAARFPIYRMHPLVAFGWSDDDSMAANNSSGFNYRVAVGKTWLSQHSYGRAIDINPVQNPYLSSKLHLPPRSVYDPSAPGTLVGDNPVVQAFERRGWEWGGRWTSVKDWHHFQKPAPE